MYVINVKLVIIGKSIYGDDSCGKFRINKSRDSLMVGILYIFFCVTWGFVLFIWGFVLEKFEKFKKEKK